MHRNNVVKLNVKPWLLCLSKDILGSKFTSNVAIITKQVETINDQMS